MDDDITAAGVKKYLGALAERISLEVTPCCPSTNTALKERAPALPAWYVLIAGQQTAGRGRAGHSFFSPADTGLYMSVLLRPQLAAEDAVLITTAAAVAVCRAAEQLGSDSARIKWVNDVYVRGRKVCGILTEAAADSASGGIRHAVLGLGVNVTAPAGGFPPEAASVAGALFPAGERDLRCRLAAAILRQLYALYGQLPRRDFVREYQRRSLLTGRQVDVLAGGTARQATVLAVDDRCRLVVRWPDGGEQALFSGEVSVRPADT